MTEPWLRGPVEGVPPILQPVAHALMMSDEDVGRACAGLTQEQWWMRPGDVAPVGFHVAHLTGSTDRLLTYARGEGLTPAQLAALAMEREVEQHAPGGPGLVGRWSGTVASTIELLRLTDDRSLLEPRSVGRAGLPSTVLGLLFHVAEHASRHTGQIVTTAKLVKAIQDSNGRG